MKPEKEGHDSFNHIIRQAIVQDPLLSFSRAGEKELPFELWKSENADMNEFKEASNPSKDSRSNLKGTKSSTEQIQALRIPEAVLAFAQAAARANGEPEKYLPGWPLLSAPKILLQKCEKCSREFCSTINYRRHVLVHRRSLNIDKDFPRNREYLGAFWDKLSLDEGKDILSFTNMTLEEVNGSSIIKSLSSWIKKPLFSSLPQAYVKAGSVLLDMLQEKPASSQLSSKELFNVLDDASEKTFLCTGTVVSLQKFVFDGEVSTIALDMKNLIACISFMLEQKLVRAWLADKDAEALRCHKLLMEEEEAAQRRQAELKERKRLKKLRQKEQKSKDLFQAGNQAPSPTAEKSHFHGTSSPRSSSLSNLYTQEISEKQNERICSVKPTVPVDHIVATDIKTEVCTAVDQNIVQHQMIDRHPNSSQHLFPRPKRATRSSISVEAPAVKASVPVRYGLYKDPKATSSAIGHKIWTRKNKNEEVPHNRKNKILQEQSVDVDSSEVIIGSICIALGNSDITSHQGKLTKPRTRQSNGKPLIGMLWKPVGHHESRDDKAIICNFREDDLAVSSCDFSDRVSHNEINFAGVERIGTTPEANQGLIVKQTNIELLLLESNTFRAFLAQRWKEAIAADHVKLVLSSETEASDCCDSPESGCFEAMPVGDSTGRGVSGALDKGLPGVGFVETFISPKPKFRTKPEKNCKLKYVPKLRNNTPGE